ncbi:MAG TPA: Asp-tRNA(Asn)/Glu-tRNA(Gln) amidotransferase subunit GatC [Candidatus Pacearchaeota archaeon]|nr:Asp-tRNA(Asn)/Glu-tRNA(Gln) amidotransferase subunit GatC [Candidatus Pacearchaeota archaeon]
MEIKKIAQLAYLLVDEKNFEKDLSAILSYVDKLKELDTSQVEETAYLFSFSDTLREDVEERKETKDVVDLMPKTQNNYLEVQEVFFEENE